MTRTWKNSKPDYEKYDQFINADWLTKNSYNLANSEKGAVRKEEEKAAKFKHFSQREAIDSQAQHQRFTLLDIYSKSQSERIGERIIIHILIESQIKRSIKTAE